MVFRSDAFYFEVTDRIAERRELAPSIAEYLARRTEINYATYARYRGKIDMG